MGHVRFTIPVIVATVIDTTVVQERARTYHAADPEFSYCRETKAGVEIGCSVDSAMTFVEVLGAVLLDAASPEALKTATADLIQKILLLVDPRASRDRMLRRQE